MSAIEGEVWAADEQGVQRQVTTPSGVRVVDRRKIDRYDAQTSLYVDRPEPARREREPQQIGTVLHELVEQVAGSIGRPVEDVRRALGGGEP